MPVIPAERATLLDELEQILVRGDERIVLGGQSGVGKSLMLDELVRALQSRGDTTVLHSRSLRLSAATPFHGLRDLLAPFTLDEFTLPAVQRDALLAALGRTAGPVASTSLVHLAVATILRELASQRRLVVAIDDIDALDDETHDLLKFVSHRSRGDVYPESYVATLTSDPALTGEPLSFDLAACSVEELRELPPLGRSAFELVVSSAVHANVDPSMFDELFARTGGNPMWAFELAYQSSQGAPLPKVPLSIAPTTAARMSALSPSVVRVLAALAVLETATRAEFELSAGIANSEVRSALAAAVIVERDGGLSPAHPVLASAALEVLGAEHVIALHSRIAEKTTDIRRRAHHLDSALDVGPDAALAALLFAAGAESRQHAASPATLHFFRRAVDRTPHGAVELVDRQRALAEVLFSRGELDECVRLLTSLDVTALTVSSLDRVVPLTLMALSAHQGEEQAARYLRELHEHLDGEPVRAALLCTYDAEVAADPGARRELADSSLRELRATKDAPTTRHRALGALIAADVDAGLGLNVALLDEAELLEKLLDSVALNDSALGQRALFAHQTGDLELSRRSLEVVRKRAYENGEVLMAGVFGVHLATVHTLAGQHDAAVERLDEWDALGAFSSPPPSVVIARGLLLLRGLDEEPLRALVAQPHEHGSEESAAMVRSALLGIAAARRERWEEAVYELERARDLARASGIDEPGRRLWLDFALSRTYVALGRFEDAAALSRALRSLSQWRRPLLDGVASRVDGMIAAHEGRAEEATTLLRQSVALLGSAGFPTETALSLFELGRQLLVTRARDEALEAFARAASVAAQAHDEQLGSIIAAVQNSSGAQTASAVLSERERAVAADAAAGSTNREIAARHFLSVRTVETQLSSAYRKLGVRSRSELTALLVR